MRRLTWIALLLLVGSTGCAHTHLAAEPMSAPSENDGSGGLFDGLINRYVEPGSPKL